MLFAKKLYTRKDIFKYKEQQKRVIVHELEPKIWVFGSGGWTKHNTDF